MTAHQPSPSSTRARFGRRSISSDLSQSSVPAHRQPVKDDFYDSPANNDHPSHDRQPLERFSKPHSPTSAVNDPSCPSKNQFIDALDLPHQRYEYQDVEFLDAALKQGCRCYWTSQAFKGLDVGLVCDPVAYHYQTILSRLHSSVTVAPVTWHAAPSERLLSMSLKKASTIHTKLVNLAVVKPKQTVTAAVHVNLSQTMRTKDKQHHASKLHSIPVPVHPHQAHKPAPKSPGLGAPTPQSIHPVISTSELAKKPAFVRAKSTGSDTLAPVKTTAQPVGVPVANASANIASPQPHPTSPSTHITSWAISGQQAGTTIAETTPTALDRSAQTTNASSPAALKDGEIPIPASTVDSHSFRPSNLTPPIPSPSGGANSIVKANANGLNFSGTTNLSNSGGSSHTLAKALGGAFAGILGLSLLLFAGLLVTRRRRTNANRESFAAVGPGPTGSPPTEPMTQTRALPVIMTGGTECGRPASVVMSPEDPQTRYSLGGMTLFSRLQGTTANLQLVGQASENPFEDVEGSEHANTPASDNVTNPFIDPAASRLAVGQPGKHEEYSSVSGTMTSMLDPGISGAGLGVMANQNTTQALARDGPSLEEQSPDEVGSIHNPFENELSSGSGDHHRQSMGTEMSYGGGVSSGQEEAVKFDDWSEGHRKEDHEERLVSRVGPADGRDPPREGGTGEQAWWD